MTAKDNYALYCGQLAEVMQRFPNLRQYQDEKGFIYLKGILDIPDDNGIIAGSFLIEIRFSPGFPLRFPYLFETGGVIPNIADWHKYTNEGCCITVPPDEILKCRNGITVLQFVKEFAIPYFANYLYRKREGKYLNGEYMHGPQGLEQFYFNLLGTLDKQTWIKYYKCVFQQEKINCERNDLCFCNSGKKYKHCHLEAFNSLRLIGAQQVLNEFKKICL